MMTQNNKAHAKRKRRSKFKIGFAVYISVLLLVFAVGLGFFYKYMEAYEDSRPEHTVERFLEEKNSSYFERLYDGYSTEFGEIDSISAVLGVDDLSECTMSFRKKVGEFTAEAPVYTVTADGITLARVELAPLGTDFFGFARWVVSDVTPSLGVTDANITIIAPADAALTVNGVLLDDSYIAKPRIEYAATGPFETGREDVPYLKSYAVTGLISTPTVEVTLGGKEMSVTSIKDGVYTYEAPPAYKNMTEITAPAGAPVYVNGILLTEEYLTGESLPYTLTEGVRTYAESVPDRVIYRVDGLCKTPVVEAKSDGGDALPIESESDGKYVFDYPASAETESAHASFVEDFVRAYIYFTSRGFDNTDENFAAFSSAYLLPGSDAYNYMRKFVESVKWSNPYEVTYHSLEIEDFIPYGERCFSCYASFDVTFSSWDEGTEYKGKFRLIFVEDGSVWRVAEMFLQA